MVGGHHVVQHAQPEALLRLEQPAQIELPVAREFEQELLLVAPVRQVPDVIGKEVSMRAWHERVP
ncbi:hypothetical protein D3C83_15110 [compost metagenome]